MPIVRDNETGLLWCSDCSIPIEEEQRAIERHREYHERLSAVPSPEEEAVATDP
jgi:hypothetical protein